MKVSVVVPAFNEERLLAGSLAAIRGSVEENAIFHFAVQATPRLRAALCAKRLCDGNGVPVELPQLGDFKPR